MKTQWKDIAPIPTSTEFLDVVLSRTQRRLPTQIRAGFKIYRIRSVCGSKRDHYMSNPLPVLHQKSEIHVGNVLRKAPGYPRWLPQTSRYSSVPPRSHEHSLRR